MNSFTSEPNPRSTRAHGSRPATSPQDESPPAHDVAQPGSEVAQPGGIGETMSQLSRDVAGLKDTLTKLVSQASGKGTKAVHDMSRSMASQVGSAASGMADTGSDL